MADINTTPQAGSTKVKKGKGFFGWLMIIVIIALIAGGLWMYFDKKGSPDNTSGLSKGVVAMVNDYKLTDSILERRTEQLKVTLQTQGVDLSQEGIDQRIKDQVIEDTINEQLILQEANKKSITVTDEVYNQSLDTIRARFENEDAFKAELDKGKYTEQEWKDSVRTQMVVQAFIDGLLKDKDVTASDEEVQAYYDQLKSQGQEVPSLDEIKDKIAEQITNEKTAQIVQGAVNEIKASANIVK